ncbi:hypothetical protein B0T14DRAFT_427666 [Immersiella caudata]|uniref:Polyprenal reductase n=1 Tax=Immersiella caudata TaxID=314043 RepID=A0AA39WXF8_9PEZI|nr:hypothetical protein B0T14DRAFT_427666 [Immersiella caudata]
MATVWSGGFIETSLLDSAKSTLETISPAQWCQVFYALTTAGVLVTAGVPREARSLLADYGARKAPGQQQGQQTPEGKQGQDWLVRLVAAVTSWGQVPHSWFNAFYGLSVACSIFWLVQFLGNGSILKAIALRQADTPEPSATRTQVAAVWGMMLLQGARRIYEHAVVMRPSKSTIWFVHWFLGLGFYLVLSVAIWVEGSSAILHGDVAESDGSSLLKISIALPAFLFAWVNQYRCHAHLAGLKKYSLPDEGLFRHLVSPHYTCECLLYLSLAIAAAPQGEVANKTMLSVLFFVLVNLGLTASSTRQWYANKFGAEAVVRRWNMIPFIF